MPISTRLLLLTRSSLSARKPVSLTRSYAKRSRPAKSLPYSARASHRPEEEHTPDSTLLQQFRRFIREEAKKTVDSITLIHLRSFLLWAFNAFLVGHLFWNHVCSWNGCYGPSMLPTLEIRDDVVMISKLHAHGRWIKAGDVISFDHPVRQDYSAIKRVIGMPGDYVLQNTPGTSDVMVMVPENHVWVAGDNLPWTRDSRHYGPLPMGLIRGKIVARVLPLRRMTWMRNSFEDGDYD